MIYTRIIEPFYHAYSLSRRKKHGVGQASRLQALKMALCYVSITTQNCRWFSRFCWWLAIYGTPQLPSPEQTPMTQSPITALEGLRDWLRKQAAMHRANAACHAPGSTFAVGNLAFAKDHDQRADAIDTAIKLLTEGAIPEGWKLVPVEPTREMLTALVLDKYPDDWNVGKELQIKRGFAVVPPNYQCEEAVGKYIRMLAATPPSPKGPASE